MTIVEQGNQPAAQTPSDLIMETTTQAFMKDVVEESMRQPVLVDFWAPWCGPCRQLTPILEKAVRTANGKVKLVKMNIDQHPAIFQQLVAQTGNQSIPAVFAFSGGRPVDGFMGVVPESQVNAFIDKLTQGVAAPGAPNIEEILNEAEAAFGAGDPDAAASIYAEVLGFDAVNIPAIAGLARCYAATGALDQAKQTLALVPEPKRGDPFVKTVQTMIDLAEQASSLGPVAERVATPPIPFSKSSNATANGTTTAPASSSCNFSKCGVPPTKLPSRGANDCRRSSFRSVPIPKFACPAATFDANFGIKGTLATL